MGTIAGGQHQVVRGQPDGHLQDGIDDLNLQVVAFLENLGLAVGIELNEDDPQFPGPGVELFPQTIGAHIPIQDVDVHLGVELFELDGVVHRVGAADPAAVGPFGLPGAHALDEDGAAGLLDRGGPFHQFGIELQVGHDPGVFAVQVFRGLEFPGAGGQHRNAVLHRHGGAVDFDLAGKVAHRSGDRLEAAHF